MKIQIKKTNENAVVPQYAHPSDGGLDLTAVSKERTEKYIEYDTGLAFAIPNNFVGLVFPRSSISKKDLTLANSVGMIDANFRGSVRLRFRYDDLGELYEVGDRIGQIMIIPRPQVEFNLVDELDDTDRGSGGFGSTDG